MNTRTPAAAEKPAHTFSRIQLALWLFRRSGRILPQLLLSSCARIAHQLLAVAIAVLAIRFLLIQPEPFFLLLILFMTLVKALLRYGEQYTGHFVAFRALQKLRTLFLRALIPLAPLKVSGRAQGELNKRATEDIDRIEVFFAHSFPPAISAILTPALTCCWIGANISPSLAITLGCCFTGVILVSVLFSARGWKKNRKIAHWRGQQNAYLTDTLQGKREIIDFHALKERIHRQKEIETSLFREMAQLAASDGLKAALCSFLYTGALVVCAFFYMRGWVSFSGAVSSLVAAFALATSVRGIEKFLSGLDDALASAERIVAVVQEKPAVQDAAKEKNVTAEAKQKFASAPENESRSDTESEGVHLPIMRVKNLWARYPAQERGSLSQQWVLRDVSVEFARGEWNVVTGVSGCGKSTLAALLGRAMDPERGEIYFERTPLTHLSLDTVRRHVLVVPQHSVLLRGTLADNLRLGAETASEEELDSVCHIADLDHWISTLPKRYATRVAEGERALSGGQLQRLAIARALLARPRILVLDESLSQLDEQSARKIRVAIRNAFPELTVIEITHRLHEINDHAEVVVIDRGSVVQRGRAADLRATEGPFSQLAYRAVAAQPTFPQPA